MRRIVSILLVSSLVLCLAACGKDVAEVPVSSSREQMAQVPPSTSNPHAPESGKQEEKPAGYQEPAPKPNPETTLSPAPSVSDAPSADPLPIPPVEPTPAVSVEPSPSPSSSSTRPPSADPTPNPSVEPAPVPPPTPAPTQPSKPGSSEEPTPQPSQTPTLPTTPVPDPEEEPEVPDIVNELQVTSGQSVGTAEKVEVGLDNQLQKGSGAIHRCTKQQLDNGYTRFTVDYTMPEGLRIFVFDPPNGSKLGIWSDYNTVQEQSRLVFDVENTMLSGITGIVVNFFTADDNRFMVMIPGGGNSAGNSGSEGNGTGNQIELTLGKPFDEITSVIFETESNLARGNGTVYDVTVQGLDNGYARFTVDYEVPKGLNVLVYDPPNGDEIKLLGASNTTGARSTVAFDIKMEQLSKEDFLVVAFFGEGNERFVVSFSTNIIFPTNGKPVGEVKRVQYVELPGLHAGTGIIHSVASQALDNDHTRFAVDYTMPEGLRIMVYNAPDSKWVSMRDDCGTPGNRRTLIFDVENRLLSKSDLIVVNFFRNGSDCFLVEFQPGK